MPALLQVAETSVIGTSQCDGQPSPRTISKTVSKETTPGMQGGGEREPTKTSNLFAGSSFILSS